MKQGVKRELVYPLLILWVAGMLAVLVAGMIKWKPETACVGVLWLAGFFLVSINLGYLVVACIGSVFVKPKILPEQDVATLPLTAILYVVKNENPSFHARMRASLRGNKDPQVHLWLISNSDKPDYVQEDAHFVKQLQVEFGTFEEN